jgi:hypothetical protein
MKRLPVESTVLASVAYSQDQSLLEVEFCDGTLYRFFDVPPACFDQLMASDSKGAYFNRNVRNHFRNQSLTECEHQN